MGHPEEAPTLLITPLLFATISQVPIVGKDIKCHFSIGVRETPYLSVHRADPIAIISTLLQLWRAAVLDQSRAEAINAPA